MYLYLCICIYICISISAGMHKYLTRNYIVRRTPHAAYLIPHHVHVHNRHLWNCHCLAYLVTKRFNLPRVTLLLLLLSRLLSVVCCLLFALCSCCCCRIWLFYEPEQFMRFWLFISRGRNWCVRPNGNGNCDSDANWERIDRSHGVW